MLVTIFEEAGAPAVLPAQPMKMTTVMSSHFDIFVGHKSRKIRR
jgi:hypothetical protein